MSLLLRRSIASSFVPSGDHRARERRTCPSPKTGRTRRTRGRGPRSPCRPACARSPRTRASCRRARRLDRRRNAGPAARRSSSPASRRSRSSEIDLMELIAVVVGAEHDAAVARRDADRPHRVVRERRQLPRPAAVDADAPQVELPGHVADEVDVLPIRAERQPGGKPPVRHELLERRKLARLRDGHAWRLALERRITKPQQVVLGREHDRPPDRTAAPLRVADRDRHLRDADHDGRLPRDARRPDRPAAARVRLVARDDLARRSRSAS